MTIYLRISSYIRKRFPIYDFATAPIWISLYMRKILFSFLSVCLNSLSISFLVRSLALRSFSQFLRSCSFCRSSYSSWYLLDKGIVSWDAYNVDFTSLDKCEGLFFAVLLEKIITNAAISSCKSPVAPMALKNMEDSSRGLRVLPEF